MPHSALLLLALVLLTGCTRRPADGLPPGVEAEDLPESESWDVRLRTSLNGERSVEIEAPYLARYSSDSAYTYLGPPPGDSSAAPVSLRLFTDGEPSGSVRAREVWLYPGDRDEPDRLVAEGSVRATQADRAEVEAGRVVVVGERIEATGAVRAQVQSGGASVRAPRVVVAEGGGFTASGGASVQLTEAGATVQARIVSGSGGRYTAQSGVRVVTRDGRTLTAERVVWDEGAQRFTAPGAFAVDGPRERVQGVGLSATADLTRYSFRRATGQIEVSE